MAVFKLDNKIRKATKRAMAIDPKQNPKLAKKLHDKVLTMEGQRKRRR